MDLVWIDDDAAADGPAAAGWLVARGLAKRGHRVSWLLRDFRDAPRWVDGVRLCPFPYDERDWAPGDGLFWGSVRMLGREIPAEAVITTGGPDAPVMVHEALRHRKMRVRHLWWPTGRGGNAPMPVEALQPRCFPAAPETVPVPVPVPLPAAQHQRVRTGPAGLLRIATGAIGAPADARDVALAALSTAAARCPGEISAHFLTMGGRDGAWQAAAAARGSLPDRAASALWAPGFDEERLWQVLAEADCYVSLSHGFDLLAAAAALAGVPVLLPLPRAADTCADGSTFRNADELAEMLTERRLGEIANTAHLRASHADPALLDDWEALLR